VYEDFAGNLAMKRGVGDSCLWIKIISQGTYDIKGHCSLTGVANASGGCPIDCVRWGIILKRGQNLYLIDDDKCGSDNLSRAGINSYFSLSFWRYYELLAGDELFLEFRASISTVKNMGSAVFQIDDPVDFPLGDSTATTIIQSTVSKCSFSATKIYTWFI
jgi:hypothetical protein